MRSNTVDRNPLYERSARRKNQYVTTHNTHNRQTSRPPVGFETIIPAGERPQTHALERATTGTGKNIDIHVCTRVSGVVLLRGMF